MDIMKFLAKLFGEGLALWAVLWVVGIIVAYFGMTLLIAGTLPANWATLNGVIAILISVLAGGLVVEGASWVKKEFLDSIL